MSTMWTYTVLALQKISSNQSTFEETSVDIEPFGISATSSELNHSMGVMEFNQLITLHLHYLMQIIIGKK
jgi:hypothetical protein